MKKILIALLAIVMITGCSTSKKTQTLFVEKNKKYALCDSEGDLKTKFKYTSYQDVQDEGYLVSVGKKTSYISKDGKDVIAYKKGVTLSVLLFQNMQESEVKCATELLTEMSTYTDIILVSSSTYGYEICDRMIYWPDNHRIDDGEYHISRNKIKEMCIMPTFIMKEIIKVIIENQTTDIAIPLWRVVPGEYEEYAYQVLNSNADKERFDYPYISHRPFRYGDVYWIMEHQLQELEVNGNRCFEEAHFIPDEAIIHAKCSEYFFRCCKEEKRIFYDYAKNHVEEL